MLVGTGQLVEQGGLAAVLISCQSEGNGLSCRKGIFARLHMVDAAFSQARVVGFLGASGMFLCCLFSMYVFDFFDLDLFGIGKPQRQLIAVDSELHGISHGCQLHQFDFCAGNHAHIQKMLPQASFPAYRQNPRGAADLQFS